MYRDYFSPRFLVDKGKKILIDLCFKIEKKRPQTLNELYKLTHAATKKFNNLEKKFEKNDNQFGRVVRESIGEDFYFIARVYGYFADKEELTAPRNW